MPEERMKEGLQHARQALEAGAFLLGESLLPLGYQYQGISEEHDEALGDHLEALFSARKISRNIRVTYVPDGNGHPDVLLVHIERDGYSTFEVEECLRWQGATEQTISKVLFKTYTGNLRKRVVQTIEAIRVVFNNQLREVVSGKEWFDVPIDWGGYK